MPKAYLKSARVSPRKAGVVAGLIRGRTVSDALVILEHTPRRSADLITKTVKSAAANAEHNHEFKPDTLVISEISITPGVRYKRYMPAARGRARRFQRKTSNISVTVEGQKREVKKPATKTEKEKK